MTSTAKYLSGQLNMTTTPQLAQSLDRELTQETNLVVVDLSDVTAVDSSALALLLEWQRRVSRTGKRLTVQCMPPALHRLAHLYGIEKCLTSLTKHELS